MRLATEMLKNLNEIYKNMGKKYFQKLGGNDYEKLIGEEFIGKNVKDGVIYYKPKYAFLGDAWWWNACKVREDMLVTPPAALCKCSDYDEPYIEREYSQDGVKMGHFKQLSKLHQNTYEKIKFEEIMGLKLHKETDLGYLYHTYSGGIEFLGVSKFPKNLKDELRKVVIEGMRDLSKYGIDYHDPLPSNLRYNFDGRLICNPHNCMECYDRELTVEEQIENLSVLLYTHSWIENPAEFLDEYFRGMIPEEETQWIKKRVRDNINDIDEYGGIVELPSHWRPPWGR